LCLCARKIFLPYFPNKTTSVASFNKSGGLQVHYVHYLFQVKDHQPKILAKMKVFFKDAEQQEPNDVMPRKKREFQCLAVCG